MKVTQMTPASEVDVRVRALQTVIERHYRNVFPVCDRDPDGLWTLTNETPWHCETCDAVIGHGIDGDLVVETHVAVEIINFLMHEESERMRRKAEEPVKASLFRRILAGLLGVGVR